jgi:cytosine/adenosine deaminase-related metal-dependent hydrolase
MTRSRINARTIVAWQSGEHRILNNGCLVLEDDRIVHVGADFEGNVDQVIDAPYRLVTPGYINTHSHLTESPLDKSFLEDRGSRQFSMTGLAEMLPLRSAAINEDAARACIDYSMAELIRTGTTTIMEIGFMGSDTADAVEKAGLRGYIANGYKSGRWITHDGKRMSYEWFEEKGKRDFAAATRFVEEIRGRASGRINGFLSPMQVDTCTADLLKESRAAADDLEVPIALHVSQSVFEFDEMTQRHGLTPVEWLESIDFLTDRCILGHVIMPAGHSWVQFQGDDLGILARHDASVAHCAWVFIRRGIVMESFADYLKTGINMCLGTDTAPQSMIEALRWSAVAGKITSRDPQKSTAKDVFNAATVNGARMLKRDDLGRIAPGAKADLLFWRTDSMFMTPLRDPIKNLVYSATPEDLADVVIDGAWVQRDGVVQTVDQERVTAELQIAAERMWSKIGPGVWIERTADEWAPPTFAEFQPPA